MKNRKLLLIISVVLALSISLGGTLAYLTDTDSDVNVMTLGNVDIIQLENGEADDGFDQGQPLYPAYYATTWTEATEATGAIKKEVNVKNVGSSDAFIRTVFAIEIGDLTKEQFEANIHLDWNIDSNKLVWLDDVVTVDGGKYLIATYTYPEAAKAGVEAGVTLKRVVMDKEANNDIVSKLGETYEIRVVSQAVQTTNFPDAVTAWEETFGEVNAENAKKWFEGEKTPYIPDVQVTAETTFDELAELFKNGIDFYVTENITVQGTAVEGAVPIETSGDIGIYMADNAVMTFENTTKFVGNGTITVNSGSLKTEKELCITGNATMVIEGGEHEFGAFSATSNGKIVVNGGVLNCRGTYAGVLGISFAENGQLIVNDGTLNMDQPFNLNANRCDAAYVEINGGTINSIQDKLFAVRNIMDKDRLEGGVLRGSSIKITGGIFTTTYQLDSDGDANAFIRNEDGTADTNRVLVSNFYNGRDDYNCVVTGGTFYGCWQRSDNNRLGTGGVVENTIIGFVADGYEMIGDSTNGYVVTAK